ncbi:zinc ribbon domain-containing protein [uncultured Roseibium sp.]|uniref:zinc ribbon domain-containing protein n=1 Tax=uncultured Roseibium sp. TaxID=1936171 RepID=UPI0026229D23|nr:zinc ribbon domain-containing protein [uncultured Roseibium sp.]
MGAKCQSCGMPLSKDPNGGGLEADGSRSSLYCSLCYDNGGFRHPEMNLQEFQEHCIAQLKAKGMP